eukprot:CAMPEP_0185796352 /NCGR_PEP_ID=MMETSP1174-20130828/161036_1 /TAXON_ID=35687 /ORGANISM="Dictyocha speculum, Strain CCMP1381" /LENGTH=203 /DNA_ID=CAMNT_0028491707 /DNA_START=483 /DNA_END=1090 /DNA_ORIENTATION=-
MAIQGEYMMPVDVEARTLPLVMKDTFCELVESFKVLGAPFQTIPAIGARRLAQSIMSGSIVLDSTVGRKWCEKPPECPACGGGCRGSSKLVSKGKPRGKRNRNHAGEAKDSEGAMEEAIEEAERTMTEAWVQLAKLTDGHGNGSSDDDDSDGTEGCRPEFALLNTLEIDSELALERHPELALLTTLLERDEFARYSRLALGET